MANEESLWVRIKPRNEKKGLRLRRYSAFGMRFEEPVGWYKVQPMILLQDGREVNVRQYLCSVRNDSEDPDSPLAFDVMTEREAKDLDVNERKAAEVRATAMDARPMKPLDMTTADLTSPAEVEEDPARPVLSQPARRGPGRPRKNAAA